MLPALTVNISSYCILQLLWQIEWSRVGHQGKPGFLLSILSGVGIGVIAWQCVEVLVAATQQTDLLEKFSR